VRTLALTLCPVCGEGRSSPELLGEQVLSRCASCGTVYAREYAHPDEVYLDGYFEGSTGFGVDISHPAFRHYIDACNRERMRRLRRVVGSPGTMLDVGCGVGLLLDAAVADGWSVTGVEPVADSAHQAAARGHDVRATTLEEADLPRDHYDVLVLSHVVEHMPTATDFLAGVSQWVRPGGHVLVEVPNYASLARRRQQESWVHYRPLEHLVYFTPRTLRRALEGAGLRVRKLSTPSHLIADQPARQMLTDLGLPRRGRWSRAARPQQIADVEVPSATPMTWRALHAADRAFERGGIGSVVLAVAQR
jgi:2-polyprenyl-3-methyl-5-hydroxy-6-metoxy-1,4-benzoquinol methylase